MPHDVVSFVRCCCRGSMVEMPISFSWSNFSVLAIGVWAIAQRDSIDAVLMVSLCGDSLLARAATSASCDTHAGV